MIDVEGEAQVGDEIDGELTYEVDTEKVVQNINLVTEQSEHDTAHSLLVGKKIGETISLEIAGMDLAVLISDNTIDMEYQYPSTIMVNAIRRKMVPELNDDFAKDLEFDSMEAMKAKISDDMRLANEHKNISIKHAAIISKLFVDNQFELPEKTLNHIASKEVEKIDNPQWKAYYEYQVKMQIAQEMINVYILNNLKTVINTEVTDSDIETYITHNAILEDKTVEAWKEANKQHLETPEFKESIKNFLILNQLTAQNEFVLAQNPADEAESELQNEQSVEISDAELVEETPIVEKQAEIFENNTEA
jgi:FKBP-type peptidyl-prolyl cis-trans isomerase (trigger factor)